MLRACLRPCSESRAVISPLSDFKAYAPFSIRCKEERTEDPQGARVALRIPRVKWIQRLKFPPNPQGISKIQTAELMETMKTNDRVGSKIVSKD